MKNEKVFSQNGAYDYIVDNNIIMHREAMVSGIRFLSQWIAKIEPPRSLRILDLACGGRPVTIDSMLREFFSYQFSYTGIDINSDQIEKIKMYSFADNIRIEKIIEGNAWDLDESGVEGKFDLIFSGLNLHHGSPEEIAFLLNQVRERLRPGGIFFNHDVYRPEGYPYIKRPDYNPKNPSESWRFVAPEKLPKKIDFVSNSTTQIGAEDDWRRFFVATENEFLRSKGQSEAFIEDCLSHVLERDFSLSLSEMKQLITNAGFSVEVDDFVMADHPLKEFFGFVCGSTPQMAVFSRQFL